MKDVTEVSREIEMGGVSEVKRFSIDMNAKAFRTLIDGLYSNKIQAIIRELWTNARDSHADAGVLDQPFECHLPTKWESFFSVRDFGVSLTHEQVLELYTTVFRSTKEKSNVGVGKFGLGSKAPFAYADQFMLTAILAGEKRIYNAFIDGEGIPTITLFATEVSDEPQGVMVSFPVNTDDIAAFEGWAKRVAMGFDVHPKCNLDLSNSQTTLMSGDGWRVLNVEYGDSQHSLHSPHVRQGCVLYPLDMSALSHAKSRRDELPVFDFHYFGRCSAIIDMPIGSVEITPSRESLSYDDRTISNLLRRIKEVQDEIAAQFSEKLNKCPTMWDAIIQRRNTATSIKGDWLKNVFERCARWRNRVIFGEIVISPDRFRSLERRGVRMVAAHWNGNFAASAKPFWASLASLDGHLRFNPNKKLMFVYWGGPGKPDGLRARLSQFIHQSGVSRAWREVIWLPNFKRGGVAEAALRATFKGVPESHFHDLAKSEFSGVDRSPIAGVAEIIRQNAPRKLTNSNVPALDAEHIYYVTRRTETKSYSFLDLPNDDGHSAREASLRDLQDIFIRMKETNIVPVAARLVVVPHHTYMTRIYNNDEITWINLGVFMKNYIQEHASKYLTDRWLRGRYHRESEWVNFADKFLNAAPINPNSPFVDSIARIRALIDKSTDGTQRVMLEMVRIAVVDSSLTEQLQQCHKRAEVQIRWSQRRLKRRYPLLAIAIDNIYASRRCFEEQKVIVEYIDMIDARDGIAPAPPPAIVVPDDSLTDDTQDEEI